MIRTEFSQVAETHGGKFYYQDEDIALVAGVRSPRVIYKLIIPYKDTKISIQNETGTAFVATCISSFSAENKSLDFKIVTRTHFSRLFRQSKQPFKVVTSHPELDAFLKSNTPLAQLKMVTTKGKFEPFIRGEFKGNLFQLKVNYHLQFSDWTHVLEPIIQFYKDFIDRFSQNKKSPLA